MSFGCWLDMVKLCRSWHRDALGKFKWDAVDATNCRGLKRVGVYVGVKLFRASNYTVVFYPQYTFIEALRFRGFV